MTPMPTRRAGSITPSICAAGPAVAPSVGNHAPASTPKCAFDSGAMYTSSFAGTLTTTAGAGASGGGGGAGGGSGGSGAATATLSRTLGSFSKRGRIDAPSEALSEIDKATRWWPGGT